MTTLLDPRNCTADRVLAALGSYRLKQERPNLYRSDSPLRPSSDSHAFHLTIDGPENGAFFDHASNERGSLYQLAERLGVDRAPKVARHTRPQLVATYDYTDEHGQVLYQACRYEPKDFRQRRPDGQGGWNWSMTGFDKYVLYRLPEVLTAVKAGEVVCIVEGEKDVNTLRMMGFTATCNVAGAAGKWYAAYTAALAGAHVVVLPDNDKPGRTHAERVISALLGTAQTIRRVELPGLADKGDVTDFFNAGHTVDEFCALIDAAPIITADSHHAQTDSQPTPIGSRESEDYAPRFIIRDENALQQIAPPTWLLTDEVQRSGYHLIYGASGSGKTFYSLDRTLRAAAAGARCLYIATEDLAGLKVRVAAWRAYHKDATGAIVWLEMPQGLDLADLHQVDELLATIGGYGLDLITIDTLREAHTGDENSSTDMAAVNRAVQRIIRETGAAVDVVHHSGVNEGRERGSTALSANCDLKFKVSPDDDRVVVSCEKYRHGLPPLPRYYRITPVESVPLGAIILPALASTTSHNAPLSAQQRKVLDTLSLSIFADIGAKTAQIADSTGLANTSLFRVLSTLKNRGYIDQGSKGDPYTITLAGRAAIGPDYTPTPNDYSPSLCPTPTTPNQLPTNSWELTPAPTTTTPTPKPRRGGSGGSREEEAVNSFEQVEQPPAGPPETAPALPPGWRIVKTDPNGVPARYGIYRVAIGPQDERTEPTQHEDEATRDARHLAAAQEMAS